MLVVSTVSTVLNWQKEFNIWLQEDDLKLNVYELSTEKNYKNRAKILSEWQNKGGVMIMGYELYRSLSDPNNKSISTMKGDEKLRDVFKTSLVNPGPDLVICDEGHILKNETTVLSMAMHRLRTKRRIILTGTPLQNNLDEYHSMIQFVKPNLLGTKRDFIRRFVFPIKNGQAADSTDHDVRLMKRRAHVLHKLLEGKRIH